jgi:hypothetical protein
MMIIIIAIRAMSPRMPKRRPNMRAYGGPAESSPGTDEMSDVGSLVEVAEVNVVRAECVSVVWSKVWLAVDVVYPPEEVRSTRESSVDVSVGDVASVKVDEGVSVTESVALGSRRTFVHLSPW